MSSSFFISDLHLDTARPDTSRALRAFLRRHRQCDALYILGDLFEAWIGDDDDAILARQTAGMLRNFSDGGSKLYLMHGNRDFLLGRDFCARVGASLLPDPTVIDLYGTPTLLMHGDSLCTADTRYQAVRQQVRRPHWREDVLARSLQERRRLAQQWRTVSRESVHSQAEHVVDVSADEVARVMAVHGVKRLIHGHTHRPGRHAHDGVERWVLGDWGKQGWAIEASTAGISLAPVPS